MLKGKIGLEAGGEFNPELDSGLGTDGLEREGDHQIESQIFSGEKLFEEEVEERMRAYFGELGAEEFYQWMQSEHSTTKFFQPSEDKALKGVSPILMAGGWTETSRTMTNEMLDLLDKGYGVMSVDHERRGTAHESPEELELSEMGVDLTKSGFQRSLNLLNAVERQGLEKMGVVAHSEGSIDALVAALIWPEKFTEGIVLVNPPLMENDNVVNLSARFIPQLLKNPLSQNMDGNKEILKNPVRAVSEVLSVGGSDILSLCKVVKEAGVPLTLVVSESDTVYPAAKVLSRLERVRHEGQEESGEDYEEHIFDLVEVIPGHHNSVHDADFGAAEIYVKHLNFIRNGGQEAG